MSYADDLRYARNPIARREPLDPRVAEAWVAKAVKIVRADATYQRLVATGMAADAPLPTAIRIRLRKSDNAWVLDGAPRLAGPEALAAAALATIHAIAKDVL